MLIGDKQNGLELRCRKDDLDEAILYIDGKVVMHMEAMSESTYWFGFYLPNGQQVHMNISSKNLKSRIEAMAEQIEGVESCQQ